MIDVNTDNIGVDDENRTLGVINGGADQKSPYRSLGRDDGLKNLGHRWMECFTDAGDINVMFREEVLQFQKIKSEIMGVPFSLISCPLTMCGV